jgi:hypothetical protein
VVREHTALNGSSTTRYSKKPRELHSSCYIHRVVHIVSLSGKDFMLEAIDVLKGVGRSQRLILPFIPNHFARYLRLRKHHLPKTPLRHTATGYFQNLRYIRALNRSRCHQIRNLSPMPQLSSRNAPEPPVIRFWIHLQSRVQSRPILLTLLGIPPLCLAIWRRRG